MTRREALGRVLAAAPAALSGCARRGRGRTTLRVSSVPYLTMSPLYLARDLGHFSDLGLDVEIIQNAEISQRLPLLLGGELDAAFLALFPAIPAAVLKGALLRLVAGRDRTSSECATTGAIYGRKDSFPDGFSDLSCLRGKRIAIGPRTGISEFFVDMLLESAGLRYDNVELVPLRQADAVAALVAGRVDALLGTRAERDYQTLAVDVIKGPSFNDVFPGFQFAFIAFGPSLLEADREKGVTFLVGYLRGVKSFLEGETPDYFEELARRSGRDPEVARAACRASFAQHGRPDLRSIDLFTRWAVRKGYCPKFVPARKFVDFSYIDEAWQRFERLYGGWESPHSGT